MQVFYLSYHITSQLLRGQLYRRVINYHGSDGVVKSVLDKLIACFYYEIFLTN